MEQLGAKVSLQKKEHLEKKNKLLGIKPNPKPTEEAEALPSLEMDKGSEVDEEQ